MFFCSTSEDSAIKAVSSAYKIRKSFMYICIDSSQRFVMLHNGSTLFSSKEDSKSLKLTVNTNKTKAVIFSKKKVRQNQSFKIKGQNIEIIDSYCYLGMLLNYNGNFCTARK
jgi:hypothetical protein